MAEWTEWKELEGTSLYSAVPHEFAGEWDREPPSTKKVVWNGR